MVLKSSAWNIEELTSIYPNKIYQKDKYYHPKMQNLK